MVQTTLWEGNLRRDSPAGVAQLGGHCPLHGKVAGSVTGGAHARVADSVPGGGCAGGRPWMLCSHTDVSLF